MHKLRHVISELVKLIPEDARKDPLVKDLAEYGCLTRMHVVRLLAPRLDNENHTKDIDFSPTGIRCAGKPVMPTRSVHCSARPGTMHATRSKASFCTSRCPMLRL
jgi:hypothetical protein